MQTLTASSCAHCGSARTTAIALTLTDGTPVDFVSCRTCEQRTWRSSDGVLGVADVLRRTTKLKVAR